MLAFTSHTLTLYMPPSDNVFQVNQHSPAWQAVAGRREGEGIKKYVGPFKGFFNMTFRFSFDDGRLDVIIRFAKPGHTAIVYREEKVANEVQIKIKKYLR